MYFGLLGTLFGTIRTTKFLTFTTTCQFVIKFVRSRPFLSNSTGLYLFVDNIYIYVIIHVILYIDKTLSMSIVATLRLGFVFC